MEAYVKIKSKDQVGTIEFFHPSHNSLPRSVLKELKEAIESFQDNEDVHILVIQSGGDRTFCAGASFDELVAIEDKVTGKEFFMGFARVINAIRKAPQLVVGRIQGKTVGGGVGLASAFDYTVVSKFASIRLSELAVGIGPFVIGPAVERKVGLPAFSKMSVTPNTWRTAQEAKEMGLFFEVFESTEEVDEFIGKFIDELSSMNPKAIRGLKKVFWEGTAHWDGLLEKRAEQSGNLVLSKYAKEAIGSFLKK